MKRKNKEDDFQNKILLGKKTKRTTGTEKITPQAIKFTCGGF